MNARRHWQRAAGALALAALGGLVCLPAQATLITGSFSFTASGFSCSAPPPCPTAPFDPVSGTVTYSFDNSTGFADATTGFTVTGIPSGLQTDGPGMTYDAGSDILIIGDLVNTASALVPGQQDWALRIDDVSKAPVFFVFAEANTANAGLTFTTQTGSLTPLGIPEPVTLMLLGIGLAGLGFARRKRMSTSWGQP